MRFLILLLLSINLSAQYTTIPVSCYNTNDTYIPGGYSIFEVSYPEAGVWQVQMDIASDESFMLQNDITKEISSPIEPGYTHILGAQIVNRNGQVPFTFSLTNQYMARYTVRTKKHKVWMIIYTESPNTQVKFSCQRMEAFERQRDLSLDILGRSIEVNNYLPNYILHKMSSGNGYNAEN